MKQGVYSMSVNTGECRAARGICFGWVRPAGIALRQDCLQRQDETSRESVQGEWVDRGDLLLIRRGFFEHSRIVIHAR
jgi:hypothetical protein